MHDSNKKLFYLEELCLQTSLSMYIFSMIYRENKQQNFYFMESNSLNQTICMKGIEFFFPRRYDTPHNGVYCLRRIKQGKNVLFFYLYQNSFCRTLKKESNSINLDFYKCLYFLSNILMQHTLFKESDSR